MSIMKSWYTLGLLGLLVPAAFGETVLQGDTNRPEMSIFIPGEPIKLRFAATGLASGLAGLKLELNIADEHEKTLKNISLPVIADGKGEWRGEVDAPRDHFGFYRVYGQLSNGVKIAKLGSRPAGFITYAVVQDPAGRKLYSQQETFFGFCGGYSDKVNIKPYMGIRWGASGRAMNSLEKDYPGQLGKELDAGKKIVLRNPDPNWVEYPYTSLLPANPKTWKDPARYYKSETIGGNNGLATWTAEGEKVWVDFCARYAKLYAAQHQDLPWHLYQLTWEPMYPWGFKGTQEDIIRIYELAYPVIHANDPKALVIGPTSSGFDLEWTTEMFNKGLGKYLDGISLHPYKAFPPEQNGVIETCREYMEIVREKSGKPLPIFATEVGFPTHEQKDKELLQSQGMIRTNLIYLGEGFQVNYSFYISDYPGEPGYGVTYNLKSEKIAFGTDKVCPKPAVPSYAAMTYILEGHRSAGSIEWLGDTAWGYAYQRGDHVVLALWDFSGATRDIQIPTGRAGVELSDINGNRRMAKTQNGLLKLSLSLDPVYVIGVAPELWGKNAVKTVRLDQKKINTVSGATIKVSGTITASGKKIDGELQLIPEPKMEAAPVTQRIKLNDGEKQSFSFEFKVPGFLTTGKYPLSLTLVSGGQTVAAEGVMLNVQSPLLVEAVEPAFFGACPGMKLQVKEIAGMAGRGKVEVRLPGVPESRQTQEFVFKPGESKELTFKWDDLDVNPLKQLKAEFGFTMASGYRFKNETEVNFLRAPHAGEIKVDGNLDDWKNIPRYKFDPSMIVRCPQYHTPAQQAEVAMAWNEKYLLFAWETQDNMFMQPQTGFLTWGYDCIQMAFSKAGKFKASGNMLADKMTQAHTEIDFALTPKGPEIYRTVSFDSAKLPEGLVAPGEALLAISKHSDANGKVVVNYEIAIPWRFVGITAPDSGTLVKWAATANFRNAEGPKQAEPSALGAFVLKNPERFGTIVLTP